MKVELEELCFGYRVTVDGIDFESMTKDEQLLIYDKVFNEIKRKVIDVDDFMLFVQLIEELKAVKYESAKEACDSCGHYYTKSTYEL